MFDNIKQYFHDNHACYMVCYTSKGVDIVQDLFDVYNEVMPEHLKATPETFQFQNGYYGLQGWVWFEKWKYAKQAMKIMRKSDYLTYRHYGKTKRKFKDRFVWGLKK